MWGLVSLLHNSNGFSTYPVSQDGQTPVLATVEDARNIRVYYEVTFNGNPSFSTWQVTRVGQLRFPLTFDINGTGTSLKQRELYSY